MSRTNYAVSGILFFLVLALGAPRPALSMNRKEMGDELQIMPDLTIALAALYERDLEGPLRMLLCLTATRHSTYVLKRSTQRKRPDWQPGASKDAFPSSHTAHVFTSATFIHKRYGLAPAVVPYALASFTAYTRIHAKKHDWIDVAGGIALPAIYSFMLAGEYDPEGKGESSWLENLAREEGWKAELLPWSPPDGGLGLGFKVSF